MEVLVEEWRLSLVTSTQSTQTKTERQLWFCYKRMHVISGCQVLFNCQIDLFIRKSHTSSDRGACNVQVDCNGLKGSRYEMQFRSFPWISQNMAYIYQGGRSERLSAPDYRLVHLRVKLLYWIRNPFSPPEVGSIRYSSRTIGFQFLLAQLGSSRFDIEISTRAFPFQSLDLGCGFSLNCA